MGLNQSHSVNKLNFESVQSIINKNTIQQFLIINTLENNNQDCLIKNTITPEKEIELLNYYLKKIKK